MTQETEQAIQHGQEGNHCDTCVEDKCGKCQDDAVRNDPAFEVLDINTKTGEVTIAIQKGITGAMANQLKNTSNRRKGSSILRKLGYVMADCGDILYGGSVDNTDVDPNVVDQPEEVPGVVG